MDISPEILEILNDKAYRLKAVGDYEGFEKYRRHYLNLQAIRWQRLRARRKRESQ